MAKNLITQGHQTFAIFKDSAFEETIVDIVDRIETSAAGKDNTWIEDLTAYTSAVADVGQKTLLMQAAILSTVKRLWEQEKVSPEITSQWDGVFWKWARHVSQRGIEPPTEVTLQNQIAVYEFYFQNRNLEGGFCLPPSLEYTIDVVNEDGQEVEQTVVVEHPNLYRAAYGKLLAAKGLAVKNGGNLSDKTIAAMINPEVSVKEFKDLLKIERVMIDGPTNLDGLDDGRTIDGQANELPQDVDISAPPSATSEVSGTEMVSGGELEETPPLVDNRDLDLSALSRPDSQGVFYQNGMLMYQQNGLTLPVFVTPTSDEGENHPLLPVGQQYILGRFGIYDEDLVSSVEPIEGPPAQATESDTILLNLNGYHFVELTVEQAVLLGESLKDALLEVNERQVTPGVDTDEAEETEAVF